MHIFADSIEVQMLLWSVVLGLVQLVIATSLATRDTGTPFNLSPRDTPSPPVSVITGRCQRAFQNFKETFVFFAVAVLAGAMTGRQNATSMMGAELYFWARLVYVPVYAMGTPVLRTLVWAASMVGMVMVLVTVL